MSVELADAHYEKRNYAGRPHELCTRVVLHDDPVKQRPSQETASMTLRDNSPFVRESSQSQGP